MDPLLGYLQDVSDHFWPDVDPENFTMDNEGNITEAAWTYSSVPQRFANRFFANRVNTDREQKYLDSEEVQDTLKAFGLGAEKFWYLCLGIKDIVEGYTENAVRSPMSAQQELRLLGEELDKMEKELEGQPLESKETGVLTFKVGKHPIKIANPKTFALLSSIIHDYLEKDTSLFHSVDIDFNDRVSLSPIYKITLFDRYMAWFLKDKVADNAINASKDKSLLISRMIFILGISDDESFFEEYREDGSKLDYLKNYIKKYKNIKITTHNVRYFSIAPLCE